MDIKKRMSQSLGTSAYTFFVYLIVLINRSQDGACEQSHLPATFRFHALP